jgi:hypothetical protein
MNSNEFVSYLKGAIKLAQIQQLTVDQLQTLTKELNAVNIEISDSGNFCTWLRGFLEANRNDYLEEQDFAKIVIKLESLEDIQDSDESYFEYHASLESQPARC